MRNRSAQPLVPDLTCCFRIKAKRHCTDVGGPESLSPLDRLKGGVVSSGNQDYDMVSDWFHGPIDARFDVVLDNGNVEDLDPGFMQEGRLEPVYCRPPDYLSQAAPLQNLRHHKGEEVILREF